ncbi:hypothetical protein E2P81_ATG07939 [Venturia nashicola]|uniref:Uncharacterized protein n=1 Tax=Venturia nashicola TaxID=86259 RepID=A0A4Z1NNQ0_9PEZI|nr:hypothetical protein E6O75_ATG08112 [Venturia nashicola]TLD26127.1 hypothetical protein E2P81_ATG07939 [Venturia nashicola]
MPAQSLKPPTFEHPRAPVVVSTTPLSILPTCDLIPGPNVTPTSQPPSVASPSDNIYFVQPIGARHLTNESGNGYRKVLKEQGYSVPYPLLQIYVISTILLPRMRASGVQKRRIGSPSSLG